MKKRFLTRILAAASLATCIAAPSAMAAYEAPVRAYGISCDDTTGVAYSLTFYGSNGGYRYVSDNAYVTHIPSIIEERHDMVFSFCVYNGRIYYVAGTAGSDTLPASIYSCNMHGDDVKILADNAKNYGNLTIVDNVLYYDAYSSYENDYYAGYSGGIYKIDLNNLSWKKIVSDKFASMDYCDGDYIYYTVDNRRTYAIDVNGNVCFAARSDTDEFDWKCYIKGNKTYYMSDDRRTLYSKDKNGGNVTALASYDKWTYIDSISNGKIYTVTLDYNNKTGAYAYVNAISIQ